MANFKATGELIKPQIAMEYNPYVLESIEKERKVLPKEPEANVDKDGVLTRTEEIKFKEQYPKYLNQVDKIELQLKQCYLTYYDQCTNDMKASIREDGGYEDTSNEKNVLALQKILKKVMSHYQSGKERVKTL